MKLIDMIYALLLQKKDKKQREIIRLRWEKEKLQKQLDRLKKDNNK